MSGNGVVIGIHGLANKPPAEEKARWWRAAIHEGIQRNASVVAPDFPFAFVYWADLRYDAPLTDETNHEPYYTDGRLGAFPEPEDAAPTLADRIYRVLDRVQERTGLTPLDDAILEYRLDDLWGYHEDAAFRDAARDRLAAALERHAGRPILIAAHSMGSLIAYDVLRRAEAAGRPLPVTHLVGLGSPLGLAEVKLRLEAEHGPLRVPAGLGAWTNLIDRHDIATVGEDLGASYGPNAAGVRVRDRVVRNAYQRPDGTVNHHKSYGYLRTPAFSRLVLDFVRG
ncbi:hypothetical protein [Methylobacterium sp. A54F]